MIKLYFLLFYEFTKIGIFALGGGYAALPFLYYIQSQYNWFSIEELTNMIAVSNITPGPIGINMATYTGYTTANIPGAIIATFSIVLIPFFMTIAITRLFTKFQDSEFVCSIFKGLRPAACALLASIGIKLLYETIIKTDAVSNYDFNYQALILFVILMIPFSLLKKNPLFIILAGAFGGILIRTYL